MVPLLNGVTAMYLLRCDRDERKKLLYTLAGWVFYGHFRTTAFDIAALPSTAGSCHNMKMSTQLIMCSVHVHAYVHATPQLGV